MLRARWMLIAVTLVGVGCGVYLLTLQNGPPTFTIDHTQPFWLQLGRGSGRNGLNTVKIDQTGRVVLHRMQSERQQEVTVLSWEVATLQLPPEALAEVLNAVESNGLMGLRKEYHGHIQDGAQWVLWIKQGGREKSVNFNNNFPRRIKAFAEQLDAILAQAGLDGVAWNPAPERESRLHERELWDSIKR